MMRRTRMRMRRTRMMMKVKKMNSRKLDRKTKTTLAGVTGETT
jgi:hypothetical protein